MNWRQNPPLPPLCVGDTRLYLCLASHIFGMWRQAQMFCWGMYLSLLCSSLCKGNRHVSAFLFLGDRYTTTEEDKPIPFSYSWRTLMKGEKKCMQAVLWLSNFFLPTHLQITLFFSLTQRIAASWIGILEVAVIKSESFMFYFTILSDTSILLFPTFRKQASWEKSQFSGSKSQFICCLDKARLFWEEKRCSFLLLFCREVVKGHWEALWYQKKFDVSLLI